MHRVAYRATVRMLGIGLAFIIFGFVDNAVMIIAGDSIDGAIGALGFSVLFSAGLGNTISDISGIMVGRVVALKLSAHLPSTEGMPTSQIILSEALGITLGCLLGLLPLLLL